MSADMIGRGFGRLTVVSRSEHRSGKELCWLCACTCGGSCHVRGYNLRSGKTASCGCWRDEQAGARSTARAAAVGPTRTCTRCLVERATDQFDRRTSGRPHSHCKPCRNERYRQAYSASAELRRTAEFKRLNAAYQRSACERLTDGYIRKELAKAFAMNASEVTEEMVRMKRDQLSLRRVARQLREAASSTKGTK